MARRGERLREHILHVAKDTFLEMGFERASMDAISARAETSKRTLYAHFESKEKLFLAVLDHVRGMFLGKLKTPGDYPGPPAEALSQFGGRFLEVLLYEPTIQMCRMLLGEADRFPEGAAQYFDLLFTAAHVRLAGYLSEVFGLTQVQADDSAKELIGRIVHPRFHRALFGIDPAHHELLVDAIGSGFDLGPVREAVEATLRPFSSVPSAVNSPG